MTQAERDLNSNLEELALASPEKIKKLAVDFAKKLAYYQQEELEQRTKLNELDLRYTDEIV